MQQPQPPPILEETTLSTDPPAEEDSSSPTPPPPQYGEDDIGVSLDYEPPNPDGLDNVRSSDVGSEDGDSSPSRTRRNRSSRRRSDQESAEESQNRRNAIGIFRFYSHHWVGQFLSGIFTGLIFFVIGVVFIVYFNTLPTYIGVLFILVSLPPCCMAINRYICME